MEYWEETDPNTYNPPTHVAWGDGTTPVKPSDNALDNEIGRGGTLGLARTCRKITGTTESKHDVFAVRFRAINLSVSHTLTDFSEVGLFDAAAGGNCLARAVFPTQNLYYDEVEFWCYLKIMPKHGPVFMNREFPRAVCEYIVDPVTNDDWNTPDKGGVWGAKGFSVPHIQFDSESENNADIIVCPQTAAQMDSFSQTKIANRYMYKIEWTYTFEYSERYNSADGDAPVAWLGITYYIAPFTNYNAYIQIWFRTDKLLSEYQDYFFHVIVWLRFLRGNIDPYKDYGNPSPAGYPCSKF